MTSALHVVSVAFCHSCFIHLASGPASAVSSVWLGLRCCLASLCSADCSGWQSHWMPSLACQTLSTRTEQSHAPTQPLMALLCLCSLSSVVLAALLSLQSSLTFKPRHARQREITLMSRACCWNTCRYANAFAVYWPCRTDVCMHRVYQQHH